MYPTVIILILFELCARKADGTCDRTLGIPAVGKQMGIRLIGGLVAISSTSSILSPENRELLNKVRDSM